MSRHAVRVLGVLAAGLLGCHRAGECFEVQWWPLFSDPHQHTTDVNQGGLVAGLDDKLRFAEAVLPPSLEGSVGLSNGERSLRAFTTCEPRCLLLVEGEGSVRELQVPSFLSERPFQGLVWLDRSILVFDQSAAPRLGIHYAVDVAAERLLLAAPFWSE